MSRPGRNTIVAIETATETVGVAVRTAAGVQADSHPHRPSPPRRDADAGPRAPAGPGRPGPGRPRRRRRRHRSRALHRPAGRCAAAKGLAQSLGMGVIGMTSLDILTAARRSGRRGLVLACVDARRGEVFAVGQRARAPGAVPGEPLAAGLFTPRPGRDARGVRRRAGARHRGRGLRYADVLAGGARRRRGRAGPGLPPPATLLDLALAQTGRGRTASRAGCIVPLYMREADATSNFARAVRA